MAWNLSRRIWISGGSNCDTCYEVECSRAESECASSRSRSGRASETWCQRSATADQRRTTPGATRAAAHANPGAPAGEGESAQRVHAYGERERSDDHSARRTIAGHKAVTGKSEDAEESGGTRGAATADESGGVTDPRRVHGAIAAVLEYLLPAGGGELNVSLADSSLLPVNFSTIRLWSLHPKQEL